MICSWFLRRPTSRRPKQNLVKHTERCCRNKNVTGSQQEILQLLVQNTGIQAGILQQTTTHFHFWHDQPGFPAHHHTKPSQTDLYRTVCEKTSEVQDYSSDTTAGFALKQESHFPDMHMGESLLVYAYVFGGGEATDLQTLWRTQKDSSVSADRMHRSVCTQENLCGFTSAASACGCDSTISATGCLFKIS